MKSTSLIPTLCIILILVASCQKQSTEQKAPDQLKNAGFENSLEGWQVGAAGGFATDAVAAKSGKFGLKFIAPSTPWNVGMFQTLEHLPDGNYSFSVYGKASGMGMYLWADGDSTVVSTPIQKAVLDSVYPLPLNTIHFTVKGGKAKVGFICINASRDTVLQPIKIMEAESAQLNKAVVDTNHPGFTGTGFVDFVDSTGDSIEWTINKADSGSVALLFRYANGSTADRPLKLEINNVAIRSRLSFPPTGSWRKWATVSDTVQLNPGVHKIKLTSIGLNGANVDHLSWQNILSAPYFYADDAQLIKIQ